MCNLTTIYIPGISEAKGCCSVVVVVILVVFLYIFKLFFFSNQLHVNVSKRSEYEISYITYIFVCIYFSNKTFDNNISRFVVHMRIPCGLTYAIDYC